MLFLYDLPNWLLGLLIVGTTTVLAFVGYWVFHKVFAVGHFTEENKHVAMAVLAVIATINSLLLAFSAVSVWETFEIADKAVSDEGNNISALARDLAVYDTPESRHVRAMLKQYADMVIHVEWSEMTAGRTSVDTWNHFDRMFLALGTLRSDTPTHQVQLAEIWERANELLKERRSRLYASQEGVPSTLWAVVLIGVSLTLGTSFVLPVTRFNLSMIGVLAVSIGLVFFFIVAMDRPFAGKESISPQPFQVAIDNMTRWDAVIAPR